MWLADVETYQEIYPGDWVHDFRGEKLKFLYITRAPNGPSQGRIFVEDVHGNKHEYFPSVIEARIVMDDPAVFLLQDDLDAEARREVDDLNRDYINGVAYDANMGWAA